MSLIDWANIVSTYCEEEAPSHLTADDVYYRYGASYDLVGYNAARQLRCLGRNLAVAGALERAYSLGWDRGNGVDICDTFSTWVPNIDGRAAEAAEGRGTGGQGR